MLVTSYLAGLQRLRWGIVAFWIALVCVSAWLYLARFHIDNSVGIWFLANDTEVAAYRDYNRTYGDKEWTFVLVQTRSIYEPEFLGQLKAAVERIEMLADVERVVSIANARDSETDADGFLQYLPILRMSGTEPTNDELQGFRERLSANPIFVNNLYQLSDERHTALLIQNANHLDKVEPYRIRLIDQVRAILAEYPAIENFALAGTTVINAELNRAAKRDMLVYYVLISIFLVVSGFLFLNHFKDVLVLLAVVTGSVLPTLGAVAGLGLAFNMVTIMLPTILVSMSVSVVVHLINDFKHERRYYPATIAMERALSVLLRPSLWTTLTTMIGFLSLTVSEVIPVRQLGFLAAFGILLAWLQTLVVAPVLLRLFWSNSKPESSGRLRWSRRVTHGALNLVERHPRKVLVIGLLLCLGLLGLLRLYADTDYVRFFRPDSTMRVDYHKIDTTDFSQYYISLDLDFAGQGYASEPAFSQVQSLERSIEALPEVRKVLSAGQLLREADRAFTGERVAADAFSKFGSTQVNQLILLAEASGNDDLSDLLTGDRSRSQLLIMTDYMSTKKLEAFRARLTELTEFHLSVDINSVATGTNVLWANMDTNVIRTQVISLLIVFTMLAVLMPLLQGSLVMGLLGLGVSMLPVLCVLGLMGWFGIEVNMATCLIGGIAIGVAVDDTIYLLHRIRHQLGRGSSLRQAVRRGILITGRAMTTTSLILIGGFLTMTLSDFMPSAEFGGLFAITILFALFGDLLLLPVLLYLLFSRQAGTSPVLPGQTN